MHKMTEEEKKIDDMLYSPTSSPIYDCEDCLLIRVDKQAATIIDLTLTRGEDEKRITELEANIARLTAANVSMQDDAVQNTFAINAFKASDKLATEKITALKKELETIKSCKHMNVKIHSHLYRPSTREEPAEYEYKAECKNCGELFSADDVDEWAEVEE